MKRLDWVIAVMLVIIGLSCLTMSATWMLNPNSIRQYFFTFFHICFWAVLPVMITVVIYLILRFKDNTPDK
ncbi:hypothetical protein CathTA2_0421 [Caldalkalibacillus thermarum TA2.A1]|uniref:Lipoprotein n=1 Tax=Caldalkalibacillus thermarum (strain TA2.A1) TaxID=986075 RepID=F5L3R0_CALTT|nr:hypothetical protein [Caldalkalibacillus thermarum]EGL84018.1 hypothetical protein CathTA2_0421 [Caldalkalibacillus thermarum TA2.A1]QZT35144.1 hypothetical protein HUR95_07985 [Caldalkalibacillus thermarum TA2.A1]GGK12754.1 hypothetical protein GCM10010965_02160 [Caldalkalibacillus thermarum]